MERITRDNSNRVVLFMVMVLLIFLMQFIAAKPTYATEMVFNEHDVYDDTIDTVGISEGDMVFADYNIYGYGEEDYENIGGMFLITNDVESYMTGLKFNFNDTCPVVAIIIDGDYHGDYQPENINDPLFFDISDDESYQLEVYIEGQEEPLIYSIGFINPIEAEQVGRLFIFGENTASFVSQVPSTENIEEIEFLAVGTTSEEFDIYLNPSVLWSINSVDTETTNGLSMNENTGVLTISDNATPGLYKVTAISTLNGEVQVNRYFVITENNTYGMILSTSSMTMPYFESFMEVAGLTAYTDNEEIQIEGTETDGVFYVNNIGANEVFEITFEGDAYSTTKQEVTANKSKYLFFNIEDKIVIDAVEPSGTGTEKDPFIIEEAGNLIWMSVNADDNEGFLGQYFKQTSDIDLERAENMYPIGLSSCFCGTYDGQGYKISNLYMNDFSDYYDAGLFGATQNAMLKNITIDNAELTNADDEPHSLGILVGYAYDSSILNCHVTGESKITGYSNVGGLVGVASGAVIEYCSSSADVTSTGAVQDIIGGIVGYATGCDIAKSYFEGSVVGVHDSISGGLIGWFDGGTILNSYNTGENASGISWYVGGLVGEVSHESDSVQISNCYTTGNVSGTGEVYLGKFAGRINNDEESENQIIIQNSFSLYEDESDYPIGTCDIMIDPGEISRTQEQLLDLDNYENWNFDNIWKFEVIGTTYPTLYAYEIEQTPSEITSSEGKSEVYFPKTGEAEAVVIDPDITVVGENTIAGAKVYIGSGFVASEDRLLYTDMNGIEGEYNTSTGILTLTGEATAEEYQEALRTVKYSNINENSTNLDNREIIFSIGDGVCYVGTGHFYEYVPSESSISWADAESQAESKEYFGLSGYLATITSSGENEFLKMKCPENSWIGASDSDEEGVWKWVTGPENGMTFADTYSNWNTNEPNNSDGNEDYAHMIGENGYWNDLNGASADGYLVEYGGEGFGDISSIKISATKNISLSRYVPSTNANLENLTISAGAPTPEFASTTENYTMTVSSTVKELTITPTVENEYATIKVNEESVLSGHTSSKISLNTGVNIITIIVTAEDEETTKTYIITVTKRAAAGAPASDNNANKETGELTGQTIKDMEKKKTILEVETDKVIYRLPAEDFNIDSVRDALGNNVDLSDIKIKVEITEADEDTVKLVEDTAKEGKYKIVVKPIEFKIAAEYNGKSVEVSEFNNYVERLIEIPEGIDPNAITTGIIYDTDNSFVHVPTQIIVIDGRYYAKINSLTNSTYSVIYNPKEFPDVSNHWAKEAVNDMASRLVINGVDENTFEPDRDITRAEFAAIVVRGLGLMRNGTGKDSFSDVNKDDWYYDAVSIAKEYKLIEGYDNKQFLPNNKITREEAITIISRAMKYTKLDMNVNNVNDQISKFQDSKGISDYAKEAIAICVKNEIIIGSNNKINPKDNITRAEVATIVRRMLQKANLI